MDREDFIIRVYCLVDDFFQSLAQSKPIRQRGPQPELTDAEVITMQVTSEFWGIDGVRISGSTSNQIGVITFPKFAAEPHLLSRLETFGTG